MHAMSLKIGFFIFLLSITFSIGAFEPDAGDELQLDVAKAILEIKKKDPGIESFFESAAGYAVFPKVGKAGMGIGGARGKGLVIEKGEAEGKSTLTQGTIGNFVLGAQASAVAVTAGASADANYDKGVAVFTNVSGGLMYEATVSGQKFSYTDL